MLVMESFAFRFWVEFGGIRGSSSPFCIGHLLRFLERKTPGPDYSVDPGSEVGELAADRDRSPRRPDRSSGGPGVAEPREEAPPGGAGPRVAQEELHRTGLRRAVGAVGVAIVDLARAGAERELAGPRRPGHLARPEAGITARNDHVDRLELGLRA